MSTKLISESFEIEKPLNNYDTDLLFAKLRICMLKIC